MSNTLQTLICAFMLYTLAPTVSTQWDFAVTTDSRIVFFNDQWKEVSSAAHQFDQLSAITFDETEEIIYFNDRKHNNGSIFSLKLPTTLNDQHNIDKIVHRTQNESIMGLAYDPLNRNIFWTDQQNKKIYFTSIDAAVTQPPKTLLDFGNEATMPDGIAIDICRRKLYFTNSNFTNATIERVDLDGSNRQIIINSDLFFPRGIVVDQTSDRIYYVVNQQGVFFSVESAKLDGSDRHVLVNGSNSIDPRSIAVTESTVFWTDKTYKSVWGHPKAHMKGTELSDLESEQVTQLNRVLPFNNEPRGIIARTGFFTKMQNDATCSSVVRKIKSRLLPTEQSNNKPNTDIEKYEREYCLNSGDYIKQSGICICKIGFKGPRCGTNECFNYCVHGTCFISPSGFPKCSCQPGFYGDRCQSYKCSSYCFNDGLCKIDVNGEPSCECKDNFGGQRCEQNSTEICSLFCRILKHEPEAYVPFGCHDICEELAERSENGEIYAIPKYQHLEVCENSPVEWNSTVITVIVCGVVISLFMVAIIVHGLRRFYKPLRPRIKKTFVVRKQAAVNGSETPLTNRPIATEQCEITIENCCNMNICDTPCFDPKILQQSSSGDSNTKDDKKVLIHNMEDELY